MHWQNTGRDIVTSALVRSQHWFGAGLFLKTFRQFYNHLTFEHCHRAGPATNHRTSPMQNVVRHSTHSEKSELISPANEIEP